MHGHGREHDFVAMLTGAKSIAQKIVLFREAIDGALAGLQQSHLGS
jgi:hypothetical protein